MLLLTFDYIIPTYDVFVKISLIYFYLKRQYNWAQLLCLEIKNVAKKHPSLRFRSFLGSISEINKILIWSLDKFVQCYLAVVFFNFTKHLHNINRRFSYNLLKSNIEKCFTKFKSVQSWVIIPTCKPAPRRVLSILQAESKHS